MKRINYILLTLAFIVTSISVNADTRYLNFDHYQISNGLSSNRVSDLAMDSRGFLWIASDCGLSRFDGAVFRNFTTSQYPSLYYNFVYQVIPSCNGSVLISGYNGFLQYYNYVVDSFETVVPKDFSETIGYLSYDKSNNRSYLHSDAGTFSLNGTSGFAKCAPLTSAENKTSNSLADGDGHLWVQAKNTISVYDAKSLALISQITFPQPCSVLTPRLTSLGNGEVIVYNNYGKLYVYKFASNRVALTNEISLPFGELRDVQVATDGSVWFATDGEGLWMTPSLSPNPTFRQVKPYGVSDYDFCKIYSLLADNNGNIWVGTSNSGLWHYSLKNRSFSSHDLGLPNCSASSFCQLPNGHMVAACDGLGLCEFSESADFLKTYTEKDGLTNRNVTDVCLDKDNRLIVSTWGSGFFEGRYAQNTYQFSHPNIQNFPNAQAKIPSFLLLNAGTCWACAGGDGVYSNSEGVWKKYPLSLGGRPENWPVKIEMGENGDLWIATSSSIWRRKNGGMELFNVDLFVGSDAYVTHDILYVPGYGLLLGTSKGILLADVKNKTFNLIPNCPQENVTTLVLDKQNRLLATVGNSILRFNLKQGKVERYPQDFNLFGNNYFAAHSAYCSASGNVYFGTSDGFFCVTDNDFANKAYTPNLCFSRIVADGKVVNLAENGNSITLSYGHSSLSVGVDMSDFSKTRPPLVYRLQGSDEWKQLGAEQVVKFDFLPTGDYELQVKTLEADEETALTLKIEVEAPWWQTWWFRLACAGLLVLLVGWRFYSISRDRRLLKIKVDERTKELNEALSAKNRIMQVVAHDLKNPVFAIYGALQNLRQKSVTTAPAEQTKALDKVIESTRTVQDELGKLLSWATAKQEDLSFQPTNINLADLIANETNLLELQAKEKSVNLTSSVNVSRYVFADARMLGTSVRNVLGNSLKFTPSGKSVAIRAWQESQCAAIEIKDEGVGMTAEQLEKLRSSSVNTSTDGTSGEKGTGLGVGLAQQYVLANGGTFAMSSEVGKGTTTVIRVPLSQIEVAETAQTSKPDIVEPEVNAELLQGNTVLVVDDDPLIAQNIKSMLEEYVDVLMASNGQEALSVVEKQAVDIVVTDVDMPVMNGFELGKQLLSNPSTNHIPLLFLSARTTENDRLTGLLTGAVDYIPKPFSRGELLMKLNNILSLRQRQQQKLLAEIGKVATPSEQVEETAAEPEKMDPYLQKVVDVIGVHFTDMNYSVEQLASDLCTSHITLYRKVKSLSGQTPLDLLTEFRLNRAHQLLTEGKTALQDVAMQVGFPDYTYFARKFKARFGCPPKDVIAK